jgi:hypothetical protein
MDMAACRSNREGGANYPWAAVGVNLTLKLAELYEVVGKKGMSAPAHFSRKPYWELLNQGKLGTFVKGWREIVVADPTFNSPPLTVLNESFCVMYCLLFIVVDRTFTAREAKYFDFPEVLAAAMVEFGKMLERARSLADLEYLVRGSAIRWTYASEASGTASAANSYQGSAASGSVSQPKRLLTLRPLVQHCVIFCLVPPLLAAASRVVLFSAGSPINEQGGPSTNPQGCSGNGELSGTIRRRCWRQHGPRRKQRLDEGNWGRRGK